MPPSERAELAERNLKKIEDELQLVGENMKQLEMSAEKAVEREEKLKVTLHPQNQTNHVNNFTVVFFHLQRLIKVSKIHFSLRILTSL